MWDENAWEDYVWWQSQDRKTLKRINMLVRDILRNGNEGLGKPEPARAVLKALQQRYPDSPQTREAEWLLRAPG